MTDDMIREKDRQIAELKKAYEETEELLDRQIEATYKVVKENAELKGQVEMGYEVYNDNLDYSHHIEEQLTKAKEIINNCVHELQNILLHKIRNKERIASILDKTEQFLKEVSE